MSFGAEDCHVAVVHKLQGGASNGYKEALLLRSTDDVKPEDEVELIRKVQNVVINMSFENFLEKFFNMYNDDAYILTKILGFETERENSEKDVETYQQYLDKKVDAISILRSVSTESDFLSLSFEEKETAMKFQEKFERSLINEEEKMSVEDNAEQVQDLLRAVSDLTSKLKEEQDRRKALEEVEIKRAEAVTLERASSFDFIPEDDVAAISTAVHTLDSDAKEAIFRAFDSAKEKISALGKAKEAVEEEEDMFRSTSMSVEDELDARALASRKILNKEGK